MGNQVWGQECALCGNALFTEEGDVVCGSCRSQPARLYAVALRTRSEPLFRKAAAIAARALLAGADGPPPITQRWLAGPDSPMMVAPGTVATMPDDYEDDPRPWPHGN